MAKKIDTNKIKLSRVRGSYLHLFRAHAMDEGDKPKFSGGFILNKKKHRKEIEMLEEAIEQVAMEKWKGKIPSTMKSCLRDGDERDGKDGYGDEVMFINASSDKRPPVVDKDLSPITEEDDIVYSGCYVNVTIRLWAQDNKFGKRVNCSLRAVQFAAAGEAFGQEPIDANDEFEEVEDDDDDDDDDDDETPLQRKKRLAKEKGRKGGGSVL